MAKKIHPQTIISGWRKATQAARDALREAAADHRSAALPLCCFFFFFAAVSSSPQPTLNAASLLQCRLHSNEASRFQEDLLNIARTTLSSKLLTHHKDHFSRLAVDAVVRLKGSGNLDAIHVIKKLGGSLTDSYLDEGEDAAVLAPPAPG